MTKLAFVWLLQSWVGHTVNPAVTPISTDGAYASKSGCEHTALDRTHLHPEMSYVCIKMPVDP
jgi:hypothetical protein